MRKIPATIATQHPDNATAPYWEKDGDGFVSNHEEMDEAMSCFRDLKVEEFMWDFEGKYADEAVIDKIFSKYYAYFKKHPLGKEKFLTFRIPNIWEEKGYSLIRALTVILTSEDFARDLKFHTPPLFEVILPMTTNAKQLLYIQKSFYELAKLKTKIFNHNPKKNTDRIEIIPLLEGIEHQMAIRKLLQEYVGGHKKYFGYTPPYIRPFLARSDPAVVSGHLATVFANKIALSEMAAFSKKTRIPVLSIIGAGGLLFRGGFNPTQVKNFVSQYAGARTLTIQSAFRYDYPLVSVKKSIDWIKNNIQKYEAQIIPKTELLTAIRVARKFSTVYNATLPKILPQMQPIFKSVPRRRERRLHIGFQAYQRHMGKQALPRAINFTAAFYSIGVPPEFIGVGRVVDKLNKKEKKILCKYYPFFAQDFANVGRYINLENLKKLKSLNKNWGLIEKDISLLEKYLGLRFKPKTQNDQLHKNLTSQALLLKNKPKELNRLITESGKIRKSLG